jgi:LmbE family N-acetylglucosaminyl deacetylase
MARRADDMKVLAVGSHFNNIEIGCGGALIKHRQKGDSITLFVAATSGFLDSERQQMIPCSGTLRSQRKLLEAS